jgi:hypothetical protein
MALEKVVPKFMGDAETLNPGLFRRCMGDLILKVGTN